MIKKGDSVIVITGKDKGKTGKVERVFPKKKMVLIPGVAIQKKHQKPRRTDQKGQIIEKEALIHISNVRIQSEEKKAKKTKTASKKK